MGVLKGFRRYTRTLLAVITAALMVSFLIFPTMQGCTPDAGGKPAATYLDRTVTYNDRQAALQRWAIAYKVYNQAYGRYVRPSKSVPSDGKTEAADPVPVLQAVTQAWRPFAGFEGFIGYTQSQLGQIGQLLNNPRFDPSTIPMIRERLQLGAAAVFEIPDLESFKPTGEEVVLRLGKAELARRAGLEVTDAQLDAHIAALGFSSDDLRGFANKDLKLKYAEVREALREDLLILNHMAAVLSEVQVTEPQFLAYLRNNLDRVGLNVAELDASLFADKFRPGLDAASADAELRKLYEAHKDKERTEARPGGMFSPPVEAGIGYRLPDRAMFEVLTLPRRDVEKLAELARLKLAQLSPEQLKDLTARAMEYYRANEADFPPPPAPPEPVKPVEPKKEEPKKEEPKKEEPKKPDPKADPKTPVEPKKAEPKDAKKAPEPAKKDEPKAEPKPEPAEKKSSSADGVFSPRPGLGDVGRAVFAALHAQTGKDDRPVAAAPPAKAEEKKPAEVPAAPAKKEAPVAKPDGKADPKAEPKADPKAEPKADPKAEPKPVVDDTAAKLERDFVERFAKVKDAVLIRVMIEDMLADFVRALTRPAYERFRAGPPAPADKAPAGLHPFFGTPDQAWSVPAPERPGPFAKPHKVEVRPVPGNLSVQDALRAEYQVSADYYRTPGLISSKHADDPKKPDVQKLRDLATARVTPAKKGDEAYGTETLIFRNDVLTAARRKAAKPGEPEVKDEPRALKVGEVSPPLRGFTGDLYFVRLLAADPARVPAFEEVRSEVADDLALEKAYEFLSKGGEGKRLAEAVARGDAKALPAAANVRELGQIRRHMVYDLDAFQKAFLRALPAVRSPNARLTGLEREAVTRFPEALQARQREQMLLSTRIWLGTGRNDHLPTVVQTKSGETRAALLDLLRDPPDPMQIMQMQRFGIPMSQLEQIFTPAEARAKAEEVVDAAFKLLEENPKGVAAVSVPSKNKVLLIGVGGYFPAEPSGTAEREDWVSHARSLAVQEVLKNYTDAKRLKEMLGYKATEPEGRSEGDPDDVGER